MASALEDSDTPLWLRTADTSTLAIPSNLGALPQDAYLPPSPSPDRELPPQDTVERWGVIDRNKLSTIDPGIYVAPKQQPAGDVVLPSGVNSFGSSTQIPNAIEIPELRGMADRSDVYGLGIRETKTPSALDDTSALTQASYAGDTLSPYARDKARLGQPSSVEGVSDEMARRFQTMVGAMPPEVRSRVEIISGFRDAARQHQVNPSVTHSRHTGTGEAGSGMALDLGNDPVVLDWIGANPQYGLGFPLRYMGPKEYNHLEMIDPKTGARAPVGGDQQMAASSAPSLTRVSQTQTPAPTHSLLARPLPTSPTNPTNQSPRHRIPP